MTIKTSGSLSITTDIAAEFGGVAPHSISEFYDGAGLVPAGANPNIPSSGAVSFSNFYGAVNVITISIINNQYDSNGTLVDLDMNGTLNLFEIANKTIGSNAGNNITVPFVFKFDSDTVFNNSIQFGGTFSDITIENNGIIAGRGGHGAPLSPAAYTKINYGNGVTTHRGNAAIWIDSDQTKVEIVNLEKGFIAGGGNQAQFGNNFISDKVDQILIANTDAYMGPSSAKGWQGWGGGWNGGRGGYGRAEVSAEVEDGDGTSRTRNDEIDIFNGGAGSIVIGRDVDNAGSDGLIAGSESTIKAHAKVRRIGAFENLEINAPVRAIGGSGLNGGERGSAFAIAENRDTITASAVESVAIANSASGSGGGGGIGTSVIPYFEASTTKISNSNAGGGNSIQLKDGKAIGTSTMTNDGRVYGNTDITIS